MYASRPSRGMTWRSPRRESGGRSTPRAAGGPTKTAVPKDACMPSVGVCGSAVREEGPGGGTRGSATTASITNGLTFSSSPRC